MTKRELYDALLKAGVKLPEYRRITQQALEEQYAIYMAKEEQEPQPEPQIKPERVQQVQQAKEQQPVAKAEEQQGKPPALFFDHAGWCDALGKSYFMGYYQPSCWREYYALRPFAKGGVK